MFLCLFVFDNHSQVGTIGGTYLAAMLIHEYKSWHQVFYFFGLLSIGWCFLFVSSFLVSHFISISLLCVFITGNNGKILAFWMKIYCNSSALYIDYLETEKICCKHKKCFEVYLINDYNEQIQKYVCVYWHKNHKKTKIEKRQNKKTKKKTEAEAEKESMRRIKAVTE